MLNFECYQRALSVEEIDVTFSDGVRDLRRQLGKQVLEESEHWATMIVAYQDLYRGRGASIHWKEIGFRLLRLKRAPGGVWEITSHFGFTRELMELLGGNFRKFAKVFKDKDYGAGVSLNQRKEVAPDAPEPFHRRPCYPPVVSAVFDEAGESVIGDAEDWVPDSERVRRSRPLSARASSADSARRSGVTPGT